MSHIAAVVGMGQLGAIFARGLEATSEVLVLGRDAGSRLETVAATEVVVLAVPEDALASVVATIPEVHRAGLVLVQNELLPPSWIDLGLPSPTVAVVWFEKKPGREAVPLLPTIVGGPRRDRIVEAIRAAGLPAVAAPDAPTLLAALLAKNLYIRVANLGGLAADLEGVAPGGLHWPHGVSSMGQLLSAHGGFARALAQETFAIDLALLGPSEPVLPSFEDAWSVVEAATAADPGHVCKGRAAPARLARAAQRATALGVRAPLIAALSRGEATGGR